MRYPLLGVLLRRVSLVVLLLAAFLFLTRDWRPGGLPLEPDFPVDGPGASWQEGSGGNFGSTGKVEPDHPHVNAKVKQVSEAIVAKYKAVPKHQAIQIARAVLKESVHQGVSPTLILAVCAVESSFNPKAVSGQDHGLMQVNVYWQKEVTNEVGGAHNLLIAAKGIYAGTKVLKTNLQRTNGNTRMALRKYNGEGKANDYPGLVLAEKKYFDSVLKG